MDRLADEGALKSYLVKSKGNPKSRGGQPSKKPAASSEIDEEHSFTIAGGFASGGPTIRGTKDNI